MDGASLKTKVFIKKNGERTTRLVNKNGVAFLEFPAFDQFDFIRNAFSTRIGGVSKDYLGTMNLGFDRGDDMGNVLENFSRFCDATGFAFERMVKGKQTHTTNVHVAVKEDMGRCFEKDQYLQDVDGLITNEPEIQLVASFADCVPLFFVDPVHRAIGLAHSGWRGTVNYMGRAMVEAMEEEYKTDPQDLVACIGPSICQDCFQVSLDVAVQFRYAFPQEYHEELIREDVAQDKFYVDLWRANEIILQKAGLKKENIHKPDICTCCNSDVLFSHRATNGRRGILCGFLAIKDPKEK